MKKIIIFILIGIFIFTISGCDEKNNVVDEPDENSSITEFIDRNINLYANDFPVNGHYGLKSFILKEEEWQVVRSLFNETKWTELEDYQDPLPERSVETGFMSFFSKYETIAFLVPECIVYTLEIISDGSTETVKNRYFTIDKEIVELLDSQVADYAAAYDYVPQAEMGG
jgi:hypothetical protein